MVDKARLDVIATERYRVPRDNSDCFVVLIEQDILGEEKRDDFARAIAGHEWDMD